MIRQGQVGVVVEYVFDGWHDKEDGWSVGVC